MNEPTMMFEETKTSARGNVRAKFTREGNSDFIEISIVGDPNVFRGKVKPEHVRRFPKEWDAYQAGKDEPEVYGTALTEVPGITKDIARQYTAKGIRCAEELAELTDMACTRIGLGAMSARKAAKHMLDAKKLAAMEQTIAALHAKEEPVKRKPGRPKKTQTLEQPAETVGSDDA